MEHNIGISLMFALRKKFDQIIPIIEKYSNQVKIWEIIDDGYSFINKERAMKLKELVESYSVKFSVHGPFVDINTASTQQIAPYFFKYLKNSLDMASLFDAKIWLCHSGRLGAWSIHFPNKAWEAQIEFMTKLADYAEDLGIKIALENMNKSYFFLLTSVKELSRFFNDERIRDRVGLCLDTGHAHLNDGVENYISNFKDQIIHMHLHDNAGNKSKDQLFGDKHSIIGHGTIDWKPVIKFLKTKYNGYVILENNKINQGIESMKQLKLMLNEP